MWGREGVGEIFFCIRTEQMDLNYHETVKKWQLTSESLCEQIKTLFSSFFILIQINNVYATIKHLFLSPQTIFSINFEEKSEFIYFSPIYNKRIKNFLTKNSIAVAIYWFFWLVVDPSCRIRTCIGWKWCKTCNFKVYVQNSRNFFISVSLNFSRKIQEV